MLKNTKLGIALTTLALTIALGATSIFAAGNYVDLLPADGDALEAWRIADIKYTGEGGSEVTATVEPSVDKDGNLVIKNINGSYPCLVIDGLEHEFDSSKKVFLDYDFTIANDGGKGQLALYNGTSELKVGQDCFPEAGDLPAKTYKGTIELTDGVAKDKLDKDGAITITGINIYSMDGAVVTVRKLAVYEEGAEPGDNKPTNSQKPTDSSKPTDTTKPGNNQTSDVAMALPLVIAAAAAFGGIKLRKSK